MAEGRANGMTMASGRISALIVTGFLALTWLVPGLIGHEPWKADEAYAIGLIQHIYFSGDWIVPRVLGDPFLQSPPLYALTAAAWGRLLGWLLPLHDAARLASATYLIIAFVAVHMAAKELRGREHAWLAVLALISAVGLAPPAHALIADVAQLAGLAVATYGLTVVQRRWIAGGIWLGTGAGIAFLSKGILGPLAMAMAAVLLPAVAPQWRNRRYAASCAVAVAAAAPWLLVWPFLLYQRSPELLAAWWTADSGMEKVGGPLLRVPTRLAYYLTVLTWFAFPALPLAAWALWRGRRLLRERADLIIPLSVFAATLLVLAFGTSQREIYALPLLVPLAVLAPVGALDLRRGAANALWWFSVLFGSFALLTTWFEYVALELGFPAARHRHWLRLQPDYVSGVDWHVVAIATAITLLWVGLIVRGRRLPARGLVAWSAGLCVVWAVALVMFLGYVDLGKSYRGVAAKIAEHVPSAARCVASRDLAQPQRILLHYYTGIQTVRVAGTTPPTCPVLIVQGQRSNIERPGPGWTLLWQGARPGDRKELLQLYRRR